MRDASWKGSAALALMMAARRSAARIGRRLAILVGIGALACGCGSSSQQPNSSCPDQKAAQSCEALKAGLAKFGYANTFQSAPLYSTDLPQAPSDMSFCVGVTIVGANYYVTSDSNSQSLKSWSDVFTNAGFTVQAKDTCPRTLDFQGTVSGFVNGFTDNSNIAVFVQ